MAESRQEVRVLLEEDVSSKFYRIKERFGLKSNTEVARLVITEAYARFFGKEGA